MDSFHFAAFIVWKPPLFPCEQSGMTNTDNMQRQLKITDKVRKVIVITDVRRDPKDMHVSPSGPWSWSFFYTNNLKIHEREANYAWVCSLTLPEFIGATDPSCLMLAGGCDNTK